FAHIFSSDGYSAGYYSYLWAEVLSQDATEAFMEAPGGMYDQAVAQRLIANVLSVGDTVDQTQAYRAFRGRDADVGAYLRNKGFPVT
ncbi:MAG TPA: M3 family metallopeptidase, partial [Phenylobacterium sp.]|nr:M3 family metallopeptidase [Phenylobacterium sp.]